MKKILFSAFGVLCFLMTKAQPLVFPIKDGEIVFEDVVTVGDSIDAGKILTRVEGFSEAKKKKYNLAGKAQEDNASVLDYNGKVRIDPEKGDYRAVDCSFKLRLTTANGRYRYEITDLYFIKEEQKFDVNEVYKGYVKSSPLVKQALEADKMAVERHEFYLKILNSKLKEMLASLKLYVTTTKA